MRASTHMRRIIGGLFACFLAFVVLTAPINAQEETYSVDYDFNFFIEKNTTDLDVELDITLTNIRSDVYITEYVMRFPQNIQFKDLKVRDNGETIPYVVSERNGAKQITFKFDEPESGAYSKNTLSLSYTLEDMHTPRGRVNEVILPLLVSSENATINATLNLPDGFDKQISISKPVPSNVQLRRIVWNDVDVQTIYTLFGESQVYDANLSYSLKNTGITPEKQTIALPPETLYQKVYIDTLDPRPDRTFTDEDGNFLAEYTIGPRGTKDIQFKGFVEVFVKPQADLREYFRTAFAKQQNYLLTEEEQWRLGDQIQNVPLSELNQAEGIYDYIVRTLNYSTDRLNDNPERLGAEKALATPKQAICTEFTDTFVAIAREKGIPAREIQGYGYSESTRIRPQSLVLDELHAWPEYYDTQQGLWVQVDPTWENTSGIDYFSGFDVNHIALAIHGKDPVTPLPAGFYKTAATQDVLIDISNTKPAANVLLDIDHTMEDSLVVGKTYDSTVSITNTGNTFVHDINVIAESQNITVRSGPLNVTYLAPYETREIPISYSVTENYAPSDTLAFTYDGAVLGQHDVRVVSPERSGIEKILVFGVGAAILGLIYIYLKRKRA